MSIFLNGHLYNKSHLGAAIILNFELVVSFFTIHDKIPLEISALSAQLQLKSFEAISMYNCLGVTKQLLLKWNYKEEQFWLIW